MEYYNNETEARQAYDEYIKGHIQNVIDAFELLVSLEIPFVMGHEEELRKIVKEHDKSKWGEDEYIPYLHHFYPLNPEEAEHEEEFDAAVYKHIRNNKHHWNCNAWVDDNNELLDFNEDEYKLYTVERCCDWLAMAYQHDESPTEYWDLNRTGIIQPQYAEEMVDEILHKVPQDFKLSFQITRGKLDESNTPSVTQKELDNNEITVHTYWLQDGKHQHYEQKFNNVKEFFKYIDECGGFNQFTNKGTIKYYIQSNYNGGEYYLERNKYAKGGWQWKDANNYVVGSSLRNTHFYEDSAPSKEYLKKNFKKVKFNSNFSSAEIVTEAKDEVKTFNMSRAEKEDIIKRTKYEYGDDYFTRHKWNPYTASDQKMLRHKETLQKKETERLIKQAEEDLVKQKQEELKTQHNKEHKWKNLSMEEIMNLSDREQEEALLYLDDIKEHFNVTREGNKYLLEANISQLKRKTLGEDPTRAKKSKHVQSKYIGISKYGVLNFMTTSETYSGVTWYQEIQFPSFQGFMNIVEQGDDIEVEDVKKAMKSDNIKISCDCPSWLFWSYKYMAWKDAYGLEKETRAPKRNNTRLKGALCKHLYSVVELLNQQRILKLVTRDLNAWCKKQLGIESDGYQDADGMMQKDFKANQYDYNVDDILKTLLSKEKFKQYQEGTPLEDLDLSDKEIKDIEDSIKGMRSRGQFQLKSDLEKEFEPVKKGRKITRDDIKLSVDTEPDVEEQ